MSVKSALLATAVAFAFAGSAHAEGCDKIVFSDVGWTDIQVTTGATSVILEALGYEPAVSTLSVPVTMASPTPSFSRAEAKTLRSRLTMRRTSRSRKPRRCRRS